MRFSNFATFALAALVCLSAVRGDDDPQPGDIRITVVPIIEGDPPAVEVTAVVCVWNDEGSCSFDDADDVVVKFECVSDTCVEGMILDDEVHVQGGDVTTMFHFKNQLGTWEVKLTPDDKPEFAQSTAVKTDRVDMAVEVLEGAEQSLPKGAEAETIIVRATDSETGDVVDSGYPIDWTFDSADWDVDCDDWNDAHTVCTTNVNADGTTSLSLRAPMQDGEITVQADGSVYDPEVISFSVHDCGDMVGCATCVPLNGCGWCATSGPEGEGTCEEEGYNCPAEEWNSSNVLACDKGSLGPILVGIGGAMAGIALGGAGFMHNKRRLAAEAEGEDGYKPLTEPDEKFEPL